MLRRIAKKDVSAKKIAYVLADFLNNRGLTWFKKNSPAYFSLLAVAVALKDSPLYKDAEYAITWKKVN